MKTFIEGSKAVAEAVTVCKPNVISAYPITPQTHIVEDLAKIVANGRIKAEFVNVESEFSAASVVLGSSATGARSYTATTSQGLFLMGEVLFNISGMRLPIVMTCANRAVSSPINIWNDQQDSLSMRDCGWIQIYAEDNQEVHDLHLQAFKIAENKDVLLPVMVCMDGFILTHSYEPVELIPQNEADKFLPQYQPEYYLNPDKPVTMGAMVGPEAYMETRFQMYESMQNSAKIIEDVANEFNNQFGRYYGGLTDTYKLEDADTAIVSLGSVLGTIKDTVDLLREKGEKVGALKIRTYRPFPKNEICEALKNIKKVFVIEKAVSIGSGGIISNEVRAAFFGKENPPKICGCTCGLGGRDITVDTILDIIKDSKIDMAGDQFVGLKKELLEDSATSEEEEKEVAGAKV